MGGRGRWNAVSHSFRWGFAVDKTPATTNSAEKRFREHTQLLKQRSQLDASKVPCQATAAYTKVVLIALSSCTYSRARFIIAFISARRAFTFQRHRVKKSSRHREPRSNFKRHHANRAYPTGTAFSALISTRIKARPSAVRSRKRSRPRKGEIVEVNHL